MDRLEDLLLQAGAAAVPEKQPAVATVNEGRSIAESLPAKYAGRHRTPIGKLSLRIVARGAGDGAIARKAAVEEQPPAEFDLLGSEWVVLRDWHVEIQSQRDRDGGE